MIDSAAASGLELRIHGDFVEWLAATAGSLAVTTYNSGKLALISAAGGTLAVHVAKLIRPMGVAYAGGRLAVATRDRILSWRLESTRSADEASFVAEPGHSTGRLDAHELAFDSHGLVFANTRFNCLARPSDRANFRRIWTPRFMKDHMRTPHDCCHLNGLGVRDGRVNFATAFCTGEEPDSWRGERRMTEGVVLDVTSDRVEASGLCMPHSPRWDGRHWWFCNSGEGTLCQLETSGGSHHAVAALPGFTRGLTFAGGRAVVGLSRIRRRHILDAPPVRERYPRLRSGLWLVDFAASRIPGALEFVRGGREVFDVAFLPGIVGASVAARREGAEGLLTHAGKRGSHHKSRCAPHFRTIDRGSNGPANL
jgi:uncharacterized protein (TIGR03032 family)